MKLTIHQLRSLIEANFRDVPSQQVLDKAKDLKRSFIKNVLPHDQEAWFAIHFFGAYKSQDKNAPPPTHKWSDFENYLHDYAGRKNPNEASAVLFHNSMKSLGGLKNALSSSKIALVLKGTITSGYTSDIASTKYTSKGTYGYDSPSAGFVKHPWDLRQGWLDDRQFEFLKDRIVDKEDLDLLKTQGYQSGRYWECFVDNHVIVSVIDLRGEAKGKDWDKHIQPILDAYGIPLTGKDNIFYG